jgi:hypothetical protein
MKKLLILTAIAFMGFSASAETIPCPDGSGQKCCKSDGQTRKGPCSGDAKVAAPAAHQLKGNLHQVSPTAEPASGK